MEMQFKPLVGQERLYAEKQSAQISGQTGYVGFLTVTLNQKAPGMQSHWETYSHDRNTAEFKGDFEAVLEALAKSDKYGKIFANRENLNAFCNSHPESRFPASMTVGDSGQENGFRADTEKYTYILRLAPEREENHCLLYAYRRDWFDDHLERAKQGIRFIDSNYKTQFTIPDGDSVKLIASDMENYRYRCRYIDPCHLELTSPKGYSDLYHICQLAERLEKNDRTLIPLRSSLPEHCYNLLPSTGEIIITKKGENDYYKTDFSYANVEDNRKLVDEYNAACGVSKAQAAAMLAGSLFGWKCSAADPKSYDDNGILKKPKFKDRGMEL